MATGGVAGLPAPTPVDDGTVEEVGRSAAPEIDWGDLGSVARGKWDKFFATGDAELYESKVEPVNVAFEAIADALRELKTITKETWPVGADISREVEQVFACWRGPCESMLLVHSHAHWHAIEMAGALVGLSGANLAAIPKDDRYRVYTSYNCAKAEGAAVRTGLLILRNLVEVAETALASCQPFDVVIQRVVPQEDRGFSLRGLFRKISVYNLTEERRERIHKLAEELASAFTEIKSSVVWQIDFWTKLSDAMSATREVDMGIIIPSRNDLWSDLHSQACSTCMDGKKLFNSGRLAAGRVDFATEPSVLPKIEW